MSSIDERAEIENKDKFFDRLQDISNKCFKFIGLIITFVFIYWNWKYFVEFGNYSLNSCDKIFTFQQYILQLALQVIIWIYLLSWSYGLNRDLKSQKYYFLSAPNSGNISILGGLNIIFLVGAILFANIFISDVRLLSVCLLIFLIINFVGWVHLKKFYKKTIEENIQRYRNEGDCIKALQLEETIHYLYDKWQTRRFLWAISFIVIINIIINSDMNSWITSGFNLKSPATIPTILIYLYVISIEWWVWYHRFFRDHTIKKLSEWDKKISISVKSKL